MTSDMEWVKEQLAAADLLEPMRASVMRLFEVWNPMVYGDDSARVVLDTFHKLALGHAIVSEHDTPDETWVQARAGAITMGDRVRVREDAFDTQSGIAHCNGHAGAVVGIRYGRIYIKFDTITVAPSQSFYPVSLEKRVR